MTINVAIVDDDELILGGLTRLIESTKEFQCSGSYCSALSALNDLPKLLPDVVLMDINLSGMNGIEYVRSIREVCPNQLVLVLTNIDDPQIIFNTLSAGASGYLLKKSSSSKQIITAVRDVYHGSSPITGSIARQLVNLLQQAVVPGQNYRSLSLRETQVIDLLAKGLRYNEIAGKLQISYATVHTHIRNIYKKLHVNCRTEAAALYLRQHPGLHFSASAREIRPVELFNEASVIRHFASTISC
jgi:DNA-binding NarL/FixJ family response regulator